MPTILLSTFRAPYGQDAGGRYIADGLQEIEIISAGRGFFELNGRLLTAERGSMIWNLPGDRTIYRNDHHDPYECLVVKLPWPWPLLAEDSVREESEATGAPAERPPRFSRWRDPDACLEFIDELQRYYHGSQPDLRLLAIYAYGTIGWQARRGNVEHEMRTLPAQVSTAQAYIEKNYQRPVAVEEIASAAAVSVPHLHALFRRELGVTPHRLLTERRMTEARRLLARTRLPIKEIAYRVGFPDAAAFCKVFKRDCGCTPGIYRERHTQKDA